MCNASEVRNTSDVKSLRLRVATLVHLRYVADECQNTDSLNIHELNQPKVLHILAGVGATNLGLIILLMRKSIELPHARLYWIGPSPR
jgi:hypothetical protein